MMNLTTKQALKIAIQNKLLNRYLYRYRSINDRFIDSIANNNIWFSKLSDFNDPFEGKLVIPEFYIQRDIAFYIFSLASNGEIKTRDTSGLINNAINNPVTFQNDIYNSLNNAVDNTKVACFTPRNDNLLMWAHYADEHKGVCLEFDVLQDLDFFLTPMPVKYKQDRPVSNYLLDQKGTVDNLIITKSDHWKYESEIRVVKPNTTCNCITYNPKALKSVIFGCKTSDKDIQKVKDILGNTVTYKRCILDDSQFKLNIEIL